MLSFFLTTTEQSKEKIVRQTTEDSQTHEDENLMNKQLWKQEGNKTDRI